MDEGFDIAQGGVLRAFGEGGVFGGGEVAGEAVVQTVDDGALPGVEGEGGEVFPEACFGEDRCEGGGGAVDGAAETAEEPEHPGGDVERAFLGVFENVVVIVAFLPDLGGHAVGALWAVFGAGEGEIGNGAGDASVVIGEG